MKDWSFITKHGLVLLYMLRNSRCTMREMAAAIGVTERTIKRILEDLKEAGYITWQKTGKGNLYEIKSTRGLKHELTREVILGDLLNLLNGSTKR
jgi:DNA-binding transcriptional regulator YhcF (GntR family)